jgi:hypothetical protein
MDGKNRLLAVKDDKNRLLSRCFLRLLWDGEKAVLYRENIYPNNISKKHERLLNEMALRKSEALGIPVVISKREKAYGKGEEAYGKILKSLSCPVPNDYCESGLCEDEKFEIPNTYYLKSS